MRVLLTGFRDTNSKARAILESYSAEVIDFPLQEMQLIPGSIKLLGKSDWVIFTSPTAARLYMQHLYPLNHFDKAACVGPSTAEALEGDYGRACSLLPETNFSASSLAKIIVENKKQFVDKKILFPCSKLAKNDLVNLLAENGISIQRHDFYLPERNQIASIPNFDAICFFSSSAVEAYFSLKNSKDLAGKKVSLIGESTAVTFRQYSDLPFVLAKEANAEETAKVLFTN
ncbi:uroporphyrinogen-III synthetase [Lentisphaera araneosa HTCC2155]|uniref:Uroporphyrinogen-III synthase n=1 Tax=Lentisphaera araneosa HTCC2155 TaxID=313628 RepID=A6DQN2_9BACT|nr:uroporphyrinogen-III synthase [Lentisphaera araneosa]EDM26113.1 uroporphyrinogen-III synthetase [Lentisphaera araneosa HTCC2155]